MFFAAWPLEMMDAGKPVEPESLAPTLLEPLRQGNPGLCADRGCSGQGGHQKRLCRRIINPHVIPATIETIASYESTSP